ncbi:unnamed protein product [Diplocarpon coronariae]
MSGFGECTLTPQARAFSSILSAFIGSVVNGLTSGWLIAFITGWITWFAFFRVVIGGSYMFYRSVTASWTSEEDRKQYAMLDWAPDQNPGFTAQLIDRRPSHQVSENASAPQHLDLSTSDPPILSELPDAEAYHRHVYTSVFGPDGSAIRPAQKQSFLSTLWPTQSDLAIRQQNALLAHRKYGELRKHYASEHDLKQALGAFSAMHKAGALPGPLPSLALHQPLNRDITILGWLGWAYAALYAPISQIIWIFANASFSSASGVGKIVKGISVAITALPLCIDTRVRFADSLREKRFGGAWAYYAFNIANALSCTLQGAICGALLVWGVVQARTHTDAFFASSFPWPLVAVYPVFSLIWAWASFRIVPAMDGGRKRAAQNHWTGYFLDVGMGAFAGVFVAAPALALYFSTVEPGEGSAGASDLGEFLRCETLKESKPPVSKHVHDQYLLGGDVPESHKLGPSTRSTLKVGEVKTDITEPPAGISFNAS